MTIDTTSSADQAAPPEASGRVVYQMTAQITTIPEINRNGGGWQRAEGEDEFLEATNAFSDSECVDALRKAVRESEGHNLAKHLDQPSVENIEVVITNV